MKFSVATRTSRIKLGPATALLPVNHPLRIVEEYNLLDVLSNGRAIFSAGRGYDEREYRAFGVPFDQSRELFDEQMAALRAARGEDADALFLELMAEHHRGGIHMAEHAAANASTGDVRRLGASIVRLQRAEIEEYRATAAREGLDADV